MSEREIHETSPKELADLLSDFWEQASIVEPSAKQAISLRVDTDVLGWFKRQGPRCQSRINAVLRSYMTQRRQSSRRRHHPPESVASGASIWFRSGNSSCGNDSSERDAPSKSVARS